MYHVFNAKKRKAPQKGRIALFVPVEDVAAVAFVHALIRVASGSFGAMHKRPVCISDPNTGCVVDFVFFWRNVSAVFFVLALTDKALHGHVKRYVRHFCFQVCGKSTFSHFVFIDDAHNPKVDKLLKG